MWGGVGFGFYLSRFWFRARVFVRRHQTLAPAQVDGNLASLHELSKMLMLDISGTNVSGDLSHLKLGQEGSCKMP